MLGFYVGSGNSKLRWLNLHGKHFTDLSLCPSPKFYFSFCFFPQWGRDSEALGLPLCVSHTHFANKSYLREMGMECAFPIERRRAAVPGAFSSWRVGNLVGFLLVLT